MSFCYNFKLICYVCINSATNSSKWSKAKSKTSTIAHVKQFENLYQAVCQMINFQHVWSFFFLHFSVYALVNLSLSEIFCSLCFSDVLTRNSLVVKIHQILSTVFVVRQIKKNHRKRKHFNWKISDERLGQEKKTRKKNDFFILIQNSSFDISFIRLDKWIEPLR
jgi:hypothetical protein